MLGWVVVALVVLATGGWLVSVRLRNASIVDVLWGAAMVLVTVVALGTGPDVTARSWLCAALVAIWGFRLVSHMGSRSFREGEDWRHRAIRARSPHFVLRSLFELFLFQLVGGGLVVGLPIMASVRDGQPALGVLDVLAVATWACGFAVEVTADRQLARFREHAPRGSLIDSGLWRYSRHPNYFGEAVQWFGIALLGVAAGSWWSLLSPAMMLVILLTMTGVRAMEEHLRATRGEAYETYARATSAFVPMPKRRPRPSVAKASDPEEQR
jgi:steroid 5-alpha reductase family enzyme